jgi:hypothetical protein
MKNLLSIKTNTLETILEKEKMMPEITKILRMNKTQEPEIIVNEVKLEKKLIPEASPMNLQRVSAFRENFLQDNEEDKLRLSASNSPFSKNSLLELNSNKSNHSNSSISSMNFTNFLNTQGSPSSRNNTIQSTSLNLRRKLTRSMSAFHNTTFSSQRDNSKYRIIFMKKAEQIPTQQNSSNNNNAPDEDQTPREQNTLAQHKTSVVVTVPTPVSSNKSTLQ